MQQKFNPKSVVDSHAQQSWKDLHVCFILCDKDCELFLFNQWSHEISGEGGPNEVPDSACLASEGLVLFVEVGKLKLVDLIADQMSSGL